MKASEPARDVTLIDYLRIATYNQIAAYKLNAEIERCYHVWEPHKWMQYKGRKSLCGVFHGQAQQKAGMHYIVQVSGQAAQIFYDWFMNRDQTIIQAFYCTRIDLQRTQTQTDKEYRLYAYKRMLGSKSLIQSDTGITLYIGSRTSDTYWRIYDKTETLLRLELELKGKQAKKAFIALLNKENLDGIWNRFLLRSRVPKVYVDYFRGDGGQATLAQLEETVDLDKKLEWLATLDALVYKLAHDHDTATRTANLIGRWSEYCASFDNPDSLVVN